MDAGMIGPEQDCQETFPACWILGGCCVVFTLDVVGLVVQVSMSRATEGKCHL